LQPENKVARKKRRPTQDAARLYSGKVRYEVAFVRETLGRLLDAADLLGLFIVVKALDIPTSSVRDKLIIICKRSSGPMVVFRCCLFFFVECVSNRGWVSKTMRV
jgi:hypothetical protein